MKTVLFLNKFDPTFVPLALKMQAKNEGVCAILGQDAVYLALKNSKAAPDISEAAGAGIKIYLLSKDVQKRGITEKIAANLELIDYDQLVDLLAEENQKVINL